jgi:hypothetical protein
MLTLQYSKRFKMQRKVFIAFAVVGIVCFSQSSYSQTFERDGNIVTYRGNKFEISEPRFDTITNTDPGTKETYMQVIRFDPTPIKMNGSKIYTTDEVESGGSYSDKNTAFMESVLKPLSDELIKLPDGLFSVDVSNIVFDANGKVAYYEFNGVQRNGREETIDATLKKSLGEKIDNILHAAKALPPAKANGKAVPIRSDFFIGDYKDFEVKNHKITFKEKRKF